MSGLRRLAGSRSAAAALVAGTVLAAFGCSNKQRLGEYDFRNRTLAVVTIAPPHPEVLSGSSLNVDPDNPIGSLISLGSAIAQEVSAQKLRPRLDSAAAAVDVSARVGERTLQNAARHLRATPVPGTPAQVDYELEIRVAQYGIVASSWDSDAYFSIDADMILLDGETGRRIWEIDVQAREPVRTTEVGFGGQSIGEVVTAVRLATMSTEEIARALESLADFCADVMVRNLAESLDEVRG